MTPSRKKFIGAIASAVAALTLLGGTGASASDASPRPVKPVTAEITVSKSTSNNITTSAWKPR